jgi:hypothetical protein
MKCNNNLKKVFYSSIGKAKVSGSFVLMIKIILNFRELIQSINSIWWKFEWIILEIETVMQNRLDNWD